VPDRWGFDSLFAFPQGGANCASPRTGQGTEGGCVHPHPAAFVKGAAGGGVTSLMFNFFLSHHLALIINIE
jgi:hypothetical protein